MENLERMNSIHHLMSTLSLSVQVISLAVSMNMNSPSSSDELCPGRFPQMEYELDATGERERVNSIRNIPMNEVVEVVPLAVDV
jgi:hypothetical protein